MGSISKWTTPTIIRYMSACCVQSEVYQILHNVLCNMYFYVITM
ncbi:hypothetical protein MtrunA17_Chr6g0477801 [Medicago truncatula]|uniref:Uncharacterized protein n=1 Tax=Medicago truncatula TaxID=3880 RepID=A0A396HFS0_MEDTR|nr:hypothetical protein MtrunA17_Chr6g0477801 [Medicago truncatula]